MDKERLNTDGREERAGWRRLLVGCRLHPEWRGRWCPRGHERGRACVSERGGCVGQEQWPGEERRLAG